MNINFTLKKVIISALTVVTAVVIFLIYSLAGLSAHPVVFSEPPAFVELYAAKKHHSKPPASLNTTETVLSNSDVSDSVQLTTDFSEEDKLVRKVILDGESPELILRLFAHPDKARRVRVASAFADVNSKLTHDEESGFAEKRDQFWIDVKANIPDIQNALYEALITSAREGTTNYIPYTLAWMPEQDHKTVEVLAWAAKHHTDPWVRKFSVFFVVQFGQNEELTSMLLKSRTHDPEYKIRKEVLDQRIRRFTGGS